MLCVSDCSSWWCSEQLVKYWCVDGGEFDVCLLSIYFSCVDDEVDVVMCFDVIVQLCEQELQCLQVGIDLLIGLFMCSVLCECVVWVICEVFGYQQMVVLFINIDYFKLINDIQGYLSGDLYLCEVVICIGVFVYEDVMVGCFGGDEFVVVMIWLQMLMVLIVLVRNICSVVVGIVGGEGFVVVCICSIGIVWWFEYGVDVDMLFSVGDVVLCYVKQVGCDCVVQFDLSMCCEVWCYVELVQGFCQVLVLDCLYVCYQLQFCLVSGCIVGLEVLCVWWEVGGVEIKVSEFILVVECSGQIVELG